MIIGEKICEFRKSSKWIESRLYDKKTGEKKYYGKVKFINGYGKNKPYAIFNFLGIKQINKINVTYSTGLKINENDKTFYRITLGSLLESGNLNKHDFDLFCKARQNPNIHVYRF